MRFQLIFVACSLHTRSSSLSTRYSLDKMASTSRAMLRTLARARPASRVATRSIQIPLRFASTLPARAQEFTKPENKHVTELRALLSSPGSLMSTLDQSATADELKAFNDDWMGKYHGKGPIVVKPKTTEEVSKVMKYCYDNGLAVVPQGGNTGLVGTSQVQSLCRS